jgi:hypothetical protein
MWGDPSAGMTAVAYVDRDGSLHRFKVHGRFGIHDEEVITYGEGWL